MDKYNLHLLIESLINFFNVTLDLWIYLINRFPWIFGLVGGWSVVTYLCFKNIPKYYYFLYVLLITILLHPLQIIFLPLWSLTVFEEKLYLPESHLYIYIGYMIIGIIMTFLLYRYTLHSLDIAISKLLKKSSLSRSVATDIRTISSDVPDKLLSYDPVKYFRKNKIFVGLSRHSKPVYFDMKMWLSSHTQLLGTTGVGKSMAAACLLTQAIRNGETIIAFDPKDDEFLPHVLKQEASLAGIDFYYIDLKGPVAQINILKGKSEAQIDEMLTTAFSLAEKGTDADFYRLYDRKAARMFANQCAAKSDSFNQLVRQFIIDNPELQENAPKFKADLEEMSALPVLSAKNGLDIKRAISKGAVIYVKGSTRYSQILKTQKMLLISFIQFIESRNRDESRSVCIFLDEFKHAMSKPAFEALSTIRDKRAHLILAHQSLGDLRDTPEDIKPDSAVATVNENCAIKLTYKIRDPDTADWLSRMSGKILIDDEMRSFTTKTLTEIKKPEKVLRQTERCLIDTNMLMSLPTRCAVLYGNGLADFVFISPIKVYKDGNDIKPTFFENNNSKLGGDEKSIAEDLLDVD